MDVEPPRRDHILPCSMTHERVAAQPERVLLAWSGGKDSTLALQALLADPTARVVGLITTVTPAYDRIAIHGVRRSILRAQGESLGLGIVEVALEPKSSNDAYVAAWKAGLDAARTTFGGFDTVAYGDLFLEDVRKFREALAVESAHALRFPIWGLDTGTLARRFINEGFEAYLSCVDTSQIPGSFAGRRFDHALLAELPAACDPCGEKGEFHTCVVNGPIFRAPIHVAPGERVLREGRFEYCDFVQASA
jgi:uncharacterized protein (TIGR00290 family)